MFSLETLRELFLYTEWADALVWNGVMSSNSARNEEMLAKLRHLHRTQQYFLAVWRGDELDYTKRETTLDEELTLARQFHRDVKPWLASLSDESLGQELSMPWADRYAQRSGAERAQPTLLGETMYQLVSHSTYHRGQANTLLRQAGVTPPNTDYIAWLWLGRPEPEWEPNA
jgi:uncharacterized damage-inducible protein DinB